MSNMNNMTNTTTGSSSDNWRKNMGKEDCYKNSSKQRSTRPPVYPKYSVQPPILSRRPYESKPLPAYQKKIFDITSTNFPQLTLEPSTNANDVLLHASVGEESFASKLLIEKTDSDSETTHDDDDTQLDELSVPVLHDIPHVMVHPDAINLSKSFHCQINNEMNQLCLKWEKYPEIYDGINGDGAYKNSYLCYSPDISDSESSIDDLSDEDDYTTEDY